MKKFIIIALLLVFLSPLACQATDINLAWNCGECRDISGFNLYQTSVSKLSDPTFKFDPNNIPPMMGIYNFNSPVLVINDPNARAATVQNLTDGIYYWVLTAFENHVANPDLPPIYNESAKSNEVSIDLDTFPPPKPGLEIKAIIKIMMQSP